MEHRKESTANVALAHTAELQRINARATVRVGANFAKPIPRLVRQEKTGNFIARLVAFGKKNGYN